MADKLEFDDLELMSASAIYGFLTGDIMSVTYIAAELDREGVTGVQLLDALAVMAASMLIQASGSKVEARAVAARRFREIAKRGASRETALAVRAT